MVREIAYLFLGLALLAQANHIPPGGHGANQRQQDRHDGGNTGEAFFSIGSPLGLIYMDFDHAQYLSSKSTQIDLTIDRWPTDQGSPLKGEQTCATQNLFANTCLAAICVTVTDAFL